MCVEPTPVLFNYLFCNKAQYSSSEPCLATSRSLSSWPKSEAVRTMPMGIKGHNIHGTSGEHVSQVMPSCVHAYGGHLKRICCLRGCIDASVLFKAGPNDACAHACRVMWLPSKWTLTLTARWCLPRRPRPKCIVQAVARSLSRLWR
jgi:hypothetical protein